MSQIKGPFFVKENDMHYYIMLNENNEIVEKIGHKFPQDCLMQAGLNLNGNYTQQKEWLTMQQLDEMIHASLENK